MSDTNPPFAPETVRRRRLRSRATHRGSHECDLLLGGYVIAHLDAMDAHLRIVEDALFREHFTQFSPQRSG